MRYPESDTNIRLSPALKCCAVAVERLRFCLKDPRRPKIRAGAPMARRRNEAVSHDPCTRYSELKPTQPAGMQRGSTSGDPSDH